MDVYESFKDLDLDNFATLLKTIIYKNSHLDILAENIDTQKDANNSFAKRLITGQAAENYFQENYNKIDIFKHYELEDTTKLGCGFDFKLHQKYFLFIVKNFREEPKHYYYQNPLKTLQFNKIEQQVTQISWRINVSA